MAKWSNTGKAWERQVGESAQAFEAFCLYCRMGAGRSIRKVGQELGKSETLLSRWSSRWSWSVRSREYDNELRRQELQAAKKECKKMQERHIQMAMLMQKKAIKALDQLDIDALSPQEILKFIMEGTKLEAASRAVGIQESKGVSGIDGQSASLAETIIAAYKKRSGGSDDV